MSDKDEDHNEITEYYVEYWNGEMWDLAEGFEVYDDACVYGEKLGEENDCKVRVCRGKEVVYECKPEIG